jgi:transmembrane sensor
MKSENDLKVNDELIAKYLSGEATPEEAMALHDWLEIPANKTLFDQFESTWNATNPTTIRSVNKQAAWQKIGVQAAAPKGRQRVMRGNVRTIAIAASVLIAAVAAVFWLRSNPSSNMDVVMTLDSTKNITLPDNSRITMYHNTGVMIPKTFDKREVTLVKGEAYFAVEKNEAKPFVVHAGFANIRVVGTEFNVTVNNDEVMVGVNEGKVLFYTDNDSIFVEKGMAVVMKPAKPAEPVDINSNNWAYATRRLVFKDTPMSDVIGAVEKTYGRSIRISNDNVKNCKLTATFDNDSVENIVLLIAETLNLTLEKNGQAFILDGTGCP